MRRFLKSPLVRISFGLVMLTIALLLISDLVGLIPNTRIAELRSRKVIAESLAVQLSTDIVVRQLHAVENILRSVVDRNENVLSAAVRMRDGNLFAEYGDHNKYWTSHPGGKSTPTQVQVPLYSQAERWGTVELRFNALTDHGRWLIFRNSFVTVVVFMALAGFFAYLLLLKRTLRELNPDKVIPDRVRKALDTLAEGLLIVDKNGYIVFSNMAFARKTGLTPANLIGKTSAGLGWEADSVESGRRTLPWVGALEGQKLSGGSRLRLKTALNKTYTFSVNVSPITAASDEIRGALITLDDITEIEAKNAELRRALDKLENTQKEIRRQNRELQELATRDPLTGALNRRSLFQGFNALYEEALEESVELSCIMVDIDHFKSVNDRFGHTVGDKVIKLLAEVLLKHSRRNDLVGRFGGEEFCVVLMGAKLDIAFDIAERMRQAVQASETHQYAPSLSITSSFGVAALSEGIHSCQELLEQADKALYAAKEGGRNRVIKWTPALEQDISVDGSVPSSIQRGSDADDVQPDEPNAIMERAPIFVQSESDKPQFQENSPVFRSTAQDANSLQSSVKEQTIGIPKDRQVLAKDVYLSNNLLLLDRIDQAIKRAQRYGTQLAVMVIGVDALQRVSDTLGLMVNAKFAKTIVARLKLVLRDMDTVALLEDSELMFNVSVLGNSEIVVMLTDLKRSEAVTSILHRIFTVHNEPVTVEGNEFFLKLNVGVSFFPVDGEDPDTLIGNASSAMREAKQSTERNSFRFYSEDINQRTKKQIQLETELYHALHREEFVLYYQPKVDLETGDISGMEALLRWQHPQLGLLLPKEFVPIAEHTGLIEAIELWVVRAVCQQIHFWRETWEGIINIAINLSPAEFRNPALSDQFIALMGEYGIPANAIEFEITETTVMQNIETMVDVLEKLTHAGFSISLDDFGTGYSSLSHLKRFPLSKVKIDRSFISDFTKESSDAAIVSAIIAMSHSLGLRVVAVGVETEEQLRLLQDLHCDEIQGYLVSQPVSTEEVTDLLSQPFNVQRLIAGNGEQQEDLPAVHDISSTTDLLEVMNDLSEKA